MKTSVQHRRPLRLSLCAASVAAFALVAAACGGGGGTPAKSASATTTTTAAATATKKTGATGSPGTTGGAATSAFTPAAEGKIASISGSILEVQNTESGQTTVNVTSKTRITATVDESLSDVKAGSCITATGTKTSTGGVKATSITIEPTTSGSCTGRFGAGTRPTGTGAGNFGSFPRGSGSFPTRTSGSRPNVTVPANSATASGKVTAVSGSTITLQGIVFSFSSFSRTTTSAAANRTSTSLATKTVDITVSSATKYTTTKAGTSASLKVGECATAFGTTNDIGAVTASRLSVTPATSTGCSGPGGGFGGFGGFGGGFGGFGHGTGGGTGANG